MADLSEVTQALLDSHMAGLAGRPDRAIVHAHRALSLEPDNPSCHSVVAEALVDLGQRAEAVEEMRKALELSPGDNAILCNAIRVYRDANEVDLAMEVADRATRTHPDDGETWRLRAQLHLWHGSVIESLQSAERAIELSPLKYDPRAFNTAAFAHGLMGEWRNANHYFDLAGPQKRRLSWSARRWHVFDLRWRRWALRMVRWLRSRVKSMAGPLDPRS